jgi:hypothetical protein
MEITRALIASWTFLDMRNVARRAAEQPPVRFHNAVAIIGNPEVGLVRSKEHNFSFTLSNQNNAHAIRERGGAQKPKISRKARATRVRETVR